MSFGFLMILAVAAINYHFVDAYSSSTGKIGDLNGAHLKIAVGHYPPFHIITLMPDGNYSNTGAGTEYFAWLKKKLNFTFSYYYIPNKMTETKYGKKDDLAIMTRLFADSEIDGASIAVILTADTKKVMDMAYYVWAEPYAMIVPRPGEKSRLLAFVYPFDILVWGLIFITMNAMVALMTLFATIYSKFSIYGREVSAFNGGKTVYDRISYYMMYIFNILTNQGNTIIISRFSFRILVGVWLLVATVLVYSYSSTVVSHLTIVFMKPHINTLEDLAASKDVEILLLATFLPPQILDAKHGAMKTLGDQIRRNPDRLLNNMQNVYTLLETGNYGMPLLATLCENYVATQFKKEHKCSFLVTDPVTNSIFWSLPFQKNSKYTWAFHRVLIELWETGLPYRWVGNFLPQAPECSAAKKKLKENSVRRGAIRLNDLAGAFFIYGIGFGLATLMFILEKIVHFKRRSNRRIFRTHKVEIE